MKVALISHSFPPDMTGGIGSYTFNLAEALTKKGIDVTVFCGGNVKEELKTSFKIRRLPMLNFPPHAVWFQLQNWKTLERELEDFDIIHGQNTSSTFYAFIKKRINKPWVVTFHDCPSRGFNAFWNSPLYAKNIGDFVFNVLEYPLYKKLYDLDLKNADKIIPVSYSLSEDLKKNFRFNEKKIRVIQNGIDIERINEIKKSMHLKKNKERFRILFFGRLFYGKGVTFIIEAMKEIIKQEKNIFLDIYGEGPLKKVLLKKIKKYDLENYVKINEFIPNNKVIEEICKSDLVIFPSLYESFPISFLEVMACSKTIIAFDYPFSREIIKNGKTGVLVEGKNSKKLAEAILNLIKNEDLREKIGRNALKIVKEKFDAKDIGDRYIRLYGGIK